MKVEELSTEGGSNDATKLTSPRVSPAKSRARREEKKKEEEEANNRAPPPIQDVEMQDPPQDEGAGQEVDEASEVPAIEVVRTQVESLERAGALSAEEEDEEGDRTVFGKLVASTKLAHELVELSSLPLPMCIRLVVVDAAL
jgi:hypothetical protein